MKSRLILIPASILSSALLLSACASTPKTNPDVQAARSKLATLQGDAQLSAYAPSAVLEADRAVTAAEQAVAAEKEKATINQLTYLANSKIDQAQARAEQGQAEAQFKELGEQRNQLMLDARTAEAQAARADAKAAQAQASMAQAQADMLRKQISELNAKQTDRGLVVTLGDVLFAPGKADLKAGAANNLDKLATFLSQYPERTATVEGHTDSTGTFEINEALSERRAEAVKNYLVSAGIDASRITAVGKASFQPIADNKTAAGRQQNRRVEIVISNQ